MMLIPKKLRLGRMRSYTPHVGNKLKRKYDVHTIPVPNLVCPIYSH
jgi:hypothetical protein